MKTSSAPSAASAPPAGDAPHLRGLGVAPRIPVRPGLRPGTGGLATAFFLIQGIAVAATLRVRPKGWTVYPWAAGSFAFNLLTGVLFFACLNDAVPFYAPRPVPGPSPTPVRSAGGPGRNNPVGGAPKRSAGGRPARSGHLLSLRDPGCSDGGHPRRSRADMQPQVRKAGPRTTFPDSGSRHFHPDGPLGIACSRVAIGDVERTHSSGGPGPCECPACGSPCSG